MGKFNLVTTLSYKAVTCCPIMIHSLKQDYVSNYFIRMFCEKISTAKHFKVVSAGKFKIVALSVCNVIPLFPCKMTNANYGMCCSLPSAPCFSPCNSSMMSKTAVARLGFMMDQNLVQKSDSSAVKILLFNHCAWRKLFPAYHPLHNLIYCDSFSY